MNSKLLNKVTVPSLTFVINVIDMMNFDARAKMVKLATKFLEYIEDFDAQKLIISWPLWYLYFNLNFVSKFLFDFGVCGMYLVFFFILSVS